MFSRSFIITLFAIIALVSAKKDKPNGGNGGNKKAVCKDFKAFKGAVGLCNAYCTAQKCAEKATPTKSCLNLKKKFASRTEGAALPCDPVVDDISAAPSATPVVESPSMAPSTTPV
ncbi:hypothetical protein MPSEU_001006000 [Mayamaea pseudoterrestris]|nr:hypothetical protein MPSEU_001006000 [Mayamaea pseudoterrestris]